MPPPLSENLISPALSLALLRMRARRSARVAAHTRVGVDPTKAYLYCVYALLGGAIIIRDLYNNYLCHFKSLCERLNESHAVFHRPVVCAVKTELYIGFKLSIVLMLCMINGTIDIRSGQGLETFEITELYPRFACRILP